MFIPQPAPITFKGAIEYREKSKEEKKNRKRKETCEIIYVNLIVCDLMIYISSHSSMHACILES